MLSPSTSTPTVHTLVSKPMLERLIQATCLYYSISEDELLNGPSHDISTMRHICWYLIKENVIISDFRIAQRFNNYNRSSVNRGIDKIRAHKNIYAPTLHDLKKILAIANSIA